MHMYKIQKVQNCTQQIVTFPLSPTSSSCSLVETYSLRECSVVSESLQPMDSSPPGSSVHGILQARTLEWVAIFFARGSSQPRDQTHVFCVSYICRQILYH